MLGTGMGSLWLWIMLPTSPGDTPVHSIKAQDRNLKLFTAVTEEWQCRMLSDFQSLQLSELYVLTSAPL
jgi:hypothetical protein